MSTSKQMSLQDAISPVLLMNASVRHTALSISIVQCVQIYQYEGNVTFTVLRWSVSARWLLYPASSSASAVLAIVAV